VSVRARDASGNTAIGYRGTVHFSSTDPAAVLPRTTRSPRRQGRPLLQRHPLLRRHLVSDGHRHDRSLDNGLAERHRGDLARFELYRISPRRVLDTRPTGSGHTNIGLSNRSSPAPSVSSASPEQSTWGWQCPSVPVNAVAVTGNLTVVVRRDRCHRSGSGRLRRRYQVEPELREGDVRANNVTLALAPMVHSRLSIAPPRRVPPPISSSM